MEKQILNKIYNRKKTGFYSLRSDFPMTKEFGISFQNLKDLNLIETEKTETETYYSLSMKGIEAIQKGLTNWVKEKVFIDIKNDDFIFSKDTPVLELKAKKELEDEGYIYEYEKYEYRVVPKMNFSISRIKKNEKKTINEENNWLKFFNLLKKFPLLALLSIIITFLGVIESENHYLNNFWKWMINLFE